MVLGVDPPGTARALDPAWTQQWLAEGSGGEVVMVCVEGGGEDTGGAEHLTKKLVWLGTMARG